MSSDDETDIPDSDTAQTLVEQFVEVTQTDGALAHFYLQDRKWDVEKSINDYFRSLRKSTGINVKDDQDGKEAIFIDLEAQKSKESIQATDATGAITSHAEDVDSNLNSPQELSNFKFITWNIDGLAERNLRSRTRAACAIIESEKPDIVHLQEVTNTTLALLKNKLPSYEFIQPDVPNYFVVTLIRKSTANHISHHVIDFPDTRMGRNILCSKVKIGKVVINSMNTHLESTKDHSDERKVQLKIAFDAMLKIAPDENAIFAGDMNLRDKELNEVKGIPSGIEDVWTTCGARSECRYTWDSSRNVNIQFSNDSKFKPRFRFDRIYFRHAKPHSVTPNHFGLVGIELIKHMQCYPSDHWGISTTFDIIA